MTRTSEGLDLRRRRLLFRSWHRGIREADLILGRFADVHISDLTESELDQYEQLMDVQEHDLLGWITGEIDVPPEQDTLLLRRLRDFHHKTVK